MKRELLNQKTLEDQHPKNGELSDDPVIKNIQTIKL